MKTEIIYKHKTSGNLIISNRWNDNYIEYFEPSKNLDMLFNDRQHNIIHTIPKWLINLDDYEIYTNVDKNSFDILTISSNPNVVTTYEN